MGEHDTTILMSLLKYGSHYEYT